jgi:hypothetical protein
LSDKCYFNTQANGSFMSNHWLRVQRPVIFLGSLLLSAVTMQGCLAIVWLGAVGIDSTRTSDIEFQSFENSWVVPPQERQHTGLVKSVAVMPFAGDPAMTERWTAVFQELTDLHVVSPSDATRYEVSDPRQIGPAQRMSAESHADCVLIGYVTGQEPKESFAGLKESSSQRLYLSLVSDSGTLLLKTELPYTVVKGAKELDEDIVTKALLTHVRAHANELGLAELGAMHTQTVSRPLRDASDQ